MQEPISFGISLITPIAPFYYLLLKYIYTAALLFTLLACRVQPVMAANVWDKAKEIMMDVCNQTVLISTIAAVVTA
jgi:hypothetical protein